MKFRHWVIIGIPGIALGGWGDDSQAADFLLEFETGAVSPETAFRDELHATLDAHLLSFVPPPTTSVAPIGSALGAPPASPLPPIDIAADSRLPMPQMPIPLGSAATSEVPPPPLTSEISALFEGDTNSLVARAIGNAEGTRTPDGQKKFAYYGHVDPGNQAWNQGTFSYQHEADSPEDADQKQLKRLKQQTEDLHHLALNQGLQLTKEEVLNGIDLANQAPIAALDRGYIDWLVQAKKMGLKGEEAILWARTRSFLDPDTGRWNAPGLGNAVQTITQDQARRQQAIAEAMAVPLQTKKPERSHNVPGSTPLHARLPEKQTDAIDIILQMDLPPKKIE